MFPLDNTLGNNGTLTPVLPNNAVSLQLLAEIQKWYSEGANQDDVVERLRLRTVPPGYKIHNWIEGTYTAVDCDYCTLVVVHRKR